MLQKVLFALALAATYAQAAPNCFQNDVECRAVKIQGQVFLGSDASGQCLQPGQTYPFPPGSDIEAKVSGCGNPRSYDSPDQNWELYTGLAGPIKFTYQADTTDWCLDAGHPKAEDGSEVTLQPCSESLSQTWMYDGSQKNPAQIKMSSQSTRCLTKQSDGNSVGAIISTCGNDDANQLWGAFWSGDE